MEQIDDYNAASAQLAAVKKCNNASTPPAASLGPREDRKKKRGNESKNRAQKHAREVWQRQKKVKENGSASSADFTFSSITDVHEQS